MSQKLPGKRN